MYPPGASGQIAFGVAAAGLVHLTKGRHHAVVQTVTLRGGEAFDFNFQVYACVAEYV